MSQAQFFGCLQFLADAIALSAVSLRYKFCPNTWMRLPCLLELFELSIQWARNQYAWDKLFSPPCNPSATQALKNSLPQRINFLTQAYWAINSPSETLPTAFGAFGTLQICAMPPSTKSSMPLTKLLSSDARKTTALAISSGVPTRPRGIFSA